VGLDETSLYVAFASAGRGKLGRVDLAGGPLELVAALHAEPARMALDDAYAYVTLPQSGDVVRVPKGRGSVVTAPSQPGVTSIVADGRGRAYWTVSTGAIARWDFTSGQSSELVSIGAPIELALEGDVLIVETALEIATVNLAGSPLIAPVSARCSGPLGVDPGAIYCADIDKITRIDRVSGRSTILAAHEDASDGVLLVAGRVVWRVTTFNGGSQIRTSPTDGIGGPTALDRIGSGSAWASNRCTLVWADGQAIVGRTL
jgi:hypothetical protein